MSQGDLARPVIEKPNEAGILRRLDDRRRASLTGRRGRLALGNVVLSYLALTAFLTWPTVANIGRSVAGFEGLDSLQYTWSLWWSRQAWGKLGHSPAHVTLLYYPWGGVSPLLAVTPLLDALALPLYALLSPTQVYNLLFLASLVLTGATTYLLALGLTGKRLPAFLAGAVFAFSSHRMGHALSGHLTQMAAWWLPLYLRYLLRALEQPTRRNALMAGLFLALSMEISPVQTAYSVIPATMVVLAYELVVRRGQLSHRHVRAAAMLFGLATLLILPTYAPFLWQVERQGTDLSVPGTVDHSVDLLTLVLPSPYHPLWGGILAQVKGLQRVFPEPNELEHSAYLGWIPLLLSCWAIARRERGVGLWGVVGLASLWLSLGPVLSVGGHTTSIPQPYALLMQLPFYRWGRTPERFNQLTMLAVALLAAQGLARLRLGPSGRWRHATGAAVIALAITEMSVLWPFPTGTPRPSAALADGSIRSGAVLDLPISKRQIGNLAMYYQTSHGQPIVGGYIHRELPGMRAYVKAVDAALTDQADGAERPLTPLEIRGWLDGLGIRRVVLHRQFVERAWVEATSVRLTEAIGPLAEDTGAELIFDVPPGPSTGAPVATFGDVVALTNAQLEVNEFNGVRLATATLYWEAVVRPRDRYTVFVHLVGDEGNRVSQHDGQPLGGGWPTSLWAPHQTLIDEHYLQLPSALPPGHYDLIVGLYRPDSGERLPVYPEDAGPEHGMWLLPDALVVE